MRAPAQAGAAPSPGRAGSLSTCSHAALGGLAAAATWRTWLHVDLPGEGPGEGVEGQPPSGKRGSLSGTPAGLRGPCPEGGGMELPDLQTDGFPWERWRLRGLFRGPVPQGRARGAWSSRAQRWTQEDERSKYLPREQPALSRSKPFPLESDETQPVTDSPRGGRVRGLGCPGASFLGRPPRGFP